MKKKCYSVMVLVLCVSSLFSAQLTGNVIDTAAQLRRRIAPVAKGLKGWQTRCMIMRDGKLVEIRKREYEAAGNLLDLVEECEESCEELLLAMKLCDLIDERGKRREAVGLLKGLVERRYYKAGCAEYFLFESRDIPAAGVYVDATADVIRAVKKVCADVNRAYGAGVDLGEVDRRVALSFGAK